MKVFDIVEVISGGNKGLVGVVSDISGTEVYVEYHHTDEPYSNTVNVSDLRLIHSYKKQNFVRGMKVRCLSDVFSNNTKDKIGVLKIVDTGTALVDFKNTIHRKWWVSKLFLVPECVDFLNK